MKILKLFNYNLTIKRWEQNKTTKNTLKFIQLNRKYNNHIK